MKKNYSRMETKTLKEIENLIYEKRLFFRVLTNEPKKKKKFGDWMALNEISPEYGNFSDYIKQLAKHNGLKEVRFELGSKNGTNPKHAGFFLVKIEPTENIDLPIKQTIIPVKELGTTENQPVVEHTKKIENIDLTTKPKMEDSTMVHIENAKMSERIIQLEKDNERLKDTNKKVENKNEELFTEVMRLNREKSSAGTLTELEIQKKEIEHQRELMNLEKEAKGGLSGIMDEIKGNPELLGTIISVFQPNNPIVKAQADKLRGEGGGGGEHDLSGNVHEDPETQSNIKDVYDLLVKLPRENVGKIGAIVGVLAAHHEKIMPVLDFINRKPGTVKTENIQEADLDEDAIIT